MGLLHYSKTGLLSIFTSNLDIEEVHLGYQVNRDGKNSHRVFDPNGEKFGANW